MDILSLLRFPHFLKANNQKKIIQDKIFGEKTSKINFVYDMIIKIENKSKYN